MVLCSVCFADDCEATGKVSIIASRAEIETLLCKAGDTLSSRHVSSCDVTRAVGMWEAI